MISYMMIQICMIYDIIHDDANMIYGIIYDDTNMICLKLDFNSGLPLICSQLQL